MQARGDNLFNLIRAFTNSSELRNAHERKLHSASQHGLVDERAVFFDFFSWFLVRCKSVILDTYMFFPLSFNSIESEMNCGPIDIPLFLNNFK